MNLTKNLSSPYNYFKSYLKKYITKTAIRAKFRQTKPLQLTIGAGTTDYPGWISTDVEILNICDPYSWSEWVKPGSIDRILCEHVFEHLTPEEMNAALSCCWRFLKPGGNLRLAVPDGYRDDQKYIDEIIPPKDGHQQMLNIDSLSKVLINLKYDITPLEYFDRDGRFTTKEWNPHEGIILRSKLFDRQIAFKRGELFYTSLIIDAKKPLN